MASSSGPPGCHFLPPWGGHVTRSLPSHNVTPHWVVNIPRKVLGFVHLHVTSLTHCGPLQGGSTIHMGRASASGFLQNFGYITALLWSPKFPGVRFFSDPQLLKSPSLPAKEITWGLFSPHSALWERDWELPSGPALGSQVGLVLEESLSHFPVSRWNLAAFSWVMKGQEMYWLLHPNPIPPSQAWGGGWSSYNTSLIIITVIKDHTTYTRRPPPHSFTVYEFPNLEGKGVGWLGQQAGLGQSSSSRAALSSLL